MPEPLQERLQQALVKATEELGRTTPLLERLQRAEQSIRDDANRHHPLTLRDEVELVRVCRSAAYGMLSKRVVLLIREMDPFSALRAEQRASSIPQMHAATYRTSYANEQHFGAVIERLLQQERDFEDIELFSESGPLTYDDEHITPMIGALFALQAVAIDRVCIGGRRIRELQNEFRAWAAYADKTAEAARVYLTHRTSNPSFFARGLKYDDIRYLRKMVYLAQSGGVADEPTGYIAERWRTAARENAARNLRPSVVPLMSMSAYADRVLGIATVGQTAHFAGHRLRQVGESANGHSVDSTPYITVDPTDYEALAAVGGFAPEIDAVMFNNGNKSLRRSCAGLIAEPTRAMSPVVELLRITHALAVSCIYPFRVAESGRVELRDSRDAGVVVRMAQPRSSGMLVLERAG